LTLPRDAQSERPRLNIRTISVKEADMETHGMRTAPTPMFKPFARASK
jgi:hypothetical protein